MPDACGKVRHRGAAMTGPLIELTDHQRQEIETLAALLTSGQIADYLGIGRTTFYRILDRDPEAMARYKQGKARAIAHVANGLLQKARSGDTTSMIFFLKTQAGWRETDRIEHSGRDGGPIETTDARGHLSLLLDRLRRSQEWQAGAEDAEPVATPAIEGKARVGDDGDAGT